MENGSYKHKKNWNNFLTYLKSWDQFGKPVGLTIDGEGEFKTLYGSAASIGLGIYMIRIFIISFIPVVLREIDTSQTQLINYDVAQESFDPFAFGFSFAVGFPQQIDKKIGTLNLSYETNRWINDEMVKTSTSIPLYSCNETSGYPMSSKRLPISMMCFDAPLESRSLTGDFFSDEFNYL